MSLQDECFCNISITQLLVYFHYYPYASSPSCFLVFLWKPKFCLSPRFLPIEFDHLPFFLAPYETYLKALALWNQSYVCLGHVCLSMSKA